MARSVRLYIEPGPHCSWTLSSSGFAQDISQEHEILLGNFLEAKGFRVGVADLTDDGFVELIFGMHGERAVEAGFDQNSQGAIPVDASFAECGELRTVGRDAFREGAW